MFRIPLLDFFRRVLTTNDQKVYFEDGKYVLEWVRWFATESGLRFIRRNRDYTVDKYLAFEVRLERNPDSRVSGDTQDIVFATGVLRSTVNEHHEPDKPFVAFPRLEDLLNYGMMGVTLVITPIED